MLAIGSSKRNHFVKKLMERMSPEDVARTDNFGLTALSKAVINGNNVAAKWLVKKNPELLNIKDRELGRDTRLLAVHYAAMRGNREMVDYLLKFTKLDGDPNPFEGQLGVQLLKTLVYGEHYVLDLVLLWFWQAYGMWWWVKREILEALVVILGRDGAGERENVLLWFWQAHGIWWCMKREILAALMVILGRDGAGERGNVWLQKRIRWMDRVSVFMAFYWILGRKCAPMVLASSWYMVVDEKGDSRGLDASLKDLIFPGWASATVILGLMSGTDSASNDIASTFLQHYPKLASIHINGDTPLKEISYRLASFRSRTRLNFVQRLIYSGIPLKLEGNANKPVGRDIENSTEGIVSPMVSQKLNAMFWDVAEKLVPTIKSVRETKLKHHRALEFVKDFCQEVVKSELSNVDVIFQGPLLNAATLGICEIVEEILDLYPSGIYFENQREQSFFQLAIENRQENVFNLIYQMDGNQDYFLATVDKFGNNALHTVGNFASRQQLSLQANVAGAALQIQRELQWFKVVENLLHPLDRYARNKDNKIAQDIFTETHKDLVKEGEKWMKDTASSCTIVAALIVTVVFAAAITVPGGANNDNGLPIYLDDRVFFLFGVFDALALFSSTASLLMFLSIFTSRYGEQDFLYSLPRKLIIGMVTLFLSIISMMIAFGATLKIVFGYKRAWVVIPIVVLSSMPITLFALLQFPLLLDMIRSTYYSGIFKKRSNRILS
ncbi:hypothetical protein Vadar_000680 [Vaccinium darrowii]|uniref:Uncharacterized protein n=1 Tax=Vaccinium darrowii TaxID=229202 RepID=A0ACB7XEF6_9ERIC|nr:hypothetical protein Vadar_000680 [Vaccinium darrowii]